MGSGRKYGVADGINNVESVNEKKFKVLSRRDLSRGAYVLRLERGGLEFEAGQYIHVGPLPGIHRREYSVYSPVTEGHLEILVKEIPQGRVTPALRRLEPGAEVAVEGPFGFFLLEQGYRDRPILFLATGTGISPFRSLVGSYPGINYRLVHGVRYLDERYEHDFFDPQRVVACITADKGGDYPGRVTSWLEKNPVDPESLVYLCGNCDMIYDAYDILKKQEIPADRIHAEVYF